MLPNKVRTVDTTEQQVHTFDTVEHIVLNLPDLTNAAVLLTARYFICAKSVPGVCPSITIGSQPRLAQCH